MLTRRRPPVPALLLLPTDTHQAQGKGGHRGFRGGAELGGRGSLYTVPQPGHLPGSKERDWFPHSSVNFLPPLPDSSQAPEAADAWGPLSTETLSSCRPEGPRPRPPYSRHLGTPGEMREAAGKLGPFPDCFVSSLKHLRISISPPVTWACRRYYADRFTSKGVKCVCPGRPAGAGRIASCRGRGRLGLLMAGSLAHSPLHQPELHSVRTLVPAGTNGRLAGVSCRVSGCPGPRPRLWPQRFPRIKMHRKAGALRAGTLARSTQRRGR